jgi:hypothetical protein
MEHLNIHASVSICSILNDKLYIWCMILGLSCSHRETKMKKFYTPKATFSVTLSKERLRHYNFSLLGLYFGSLVWFIKSVLEFRISKSLNRDLRSYLHITKMHSLRILGWKTASSSYTLLVENKLVHLLWRSIWIVLKN